MKSFIKCFLVILIALSCSKHNDDPGNSSSVRITINNFPDDADTINCNFHSVLNVSIVGAQFQKYVLKTFIHNFLLLNDSSYDGTFIVILPRHIRRLTAFTAPQEGFLFPQITSTF